MLNCRYILLFLLILFPVFSFTLQAQPIRVHGTVTDAATGEPLPYATVSLLPVKAGMVVQTDDNGEYQLSFNARGERLQFMYVGYNTEVIALKSIKNGVLNVKMKATDTKLSEVVVSAKRVRYSNRNNPAVDLIRKAIARKDRNRIEANSTYEYERYEKIMLSINNLSDSVRNGFLFRQFPFLANYIDTSEQTGALSLPVFLRENISEHYYRNDPEASKEYLIASKMVNFHDMLERGLLAPFLDGMVRRTNIYDNRIVVLENECLSPMSPQSPNYYRFHIIDTVQVSDVSCINLNFYPRNDQDFGFRGNIYITNDSAYAVKRVELAFTRNSSANFVNDFSLIQEYSRIDSSWCLTLDEAVIDFGLSKNTQGMMVGKRTNTYGKYKLNHYISDGMFGGVNKVDELPGFDMRAEEYWQENRIVPLSKQEQGVYNMVEEMRQDKWFNRMLDLVGLAFSGYISVGKFDIGRMESFASFNDVEGLRLRFGGKTNVHFHERLYLEGYGAYGFADERFKYKLGAMYSFAPRKQHPWEQPMNLLSASYESNIETPGQFFLFGTADRFFLSFHRGKAQQMVYHKTLTVDYHREYKSGFSWSPSFTHKEQTPAGDLKFENGHGEHKTLSTSQVGVKLRFAPNERFYQLQANRFPLNHTYPVISLNYSYGIPGFWDSEYAFHRVELGLDKRTWFASLGFLDVWAKAGMIFGTVPFPLLVIHQANQNYAYQDEAFNMMNYMEFVSDKYVMANLSYCLNGWLFNRIPLVKKLKWREYFTFKALWGNVNERNMPENNPDLFRFPVNADGIPTMYALGDTPYMEASFAIDNIFKVLRLDLVKRLNYLNHPDIAEWGVRFRLRFVF